MCKGRSEIMADYWKTWTRDSPYQNTLCAGMEILAFLFWVFIFFHFWHFFSTCEKMTQYLEFCKDQGGKI